MNQALEGVTMTMRVAVALTQASQSSGVVGTSVRPLALRVSASMPMEIHNGGTC